MVERDGEGRHAAARPLLAYAPEFLEPARFSSPAEDDEEREHQKRRAELLRRKQELLEAETTGATDPKTDMQNRMDAVRDALQDNLRALPDEPQSVKAVPPSPSVSHAEPVSPQQTRHRRRWGLLAGFTLLGGIFGVTYAFLVPPQYSATASMQVFPPERRSEVASDAVLTRAARMAHVESVADLGAPPLLDELRVRLIWMLPESLRTRFDFSLPDRSPAQLLRQRLDFSQALDSGTVNVEATADRPATAALLATAVAQSFRDHLHHTASDAARGDLPSRLQALEADAQAARQAAAAFRASRNFGDDDNKAALEREFAYAKAETVRIAAEANALNGATADSLVRDGVPENMRSGPLGALVERYRVAGQGDEAKKVGTEIDAEISSQRGALQADLKNAVEREQKAAAAIAGLGTAPATGEDRNRLLTLERDAAAKQALLEDLQMRAARGETGSSGLSGASGSGATVRIVTPAVAEPNPSGLPAPATISLALLAGFLLGLLSMALAGRSRDTLDRAEAEPEEVLEPYGETRLATVIREANARWEAEHGRMNPVAENEELGRVLEDVRSRRA